MRAFIADYWWALCGAILMIALLIVRYRNRRRFQAPSDARSFAAIRVLRPYELAPYFGTYFPSWRDHIRFLFFIVWFAAIVGVVIGDLSSGSAGLTFLSVAAALAVAAVAVFSDMRSARVIGPDRIAFESPFSKFSWSVPLTRVTQCDVVPGKPQPRLRVHTDVASFSLPLTSELWTALSEPPPN